ncbi:UNVERIFIED_CONTAM: hypothetical protein Slati_3004200 [Sesamum latifolium]|uniref:Uncharacterized protein n=1 Tax=Sesamum latifolium TaxID=2727402 RepID=A0AAW2VH70_9LAMI
MGRGSFDSQKGGGSNGGGLRPWVTPVTESTAGVCGGQGESAIAMVDETENYLGGNDRIELRSRMV